MHLYPWRKRFRQQLLTPVMLMLAFICWSCGGRSSQSWDKMEPAPQKQLSVIGYTIQVGAFSNMNNAVQFTETLRTKRINAYHFRHASGLYKVRFGNYTSKTNARKTAEALKAVGIITDYYLVKPDEFVAYSARTGNRDRIRFEIVKTAKQYIGIPYRWGGESPRTGFDCSGLTMVVYRLNGLDLPRSSAQQWRSGRPIKRRNLAQGDLVFFATSGGNRVSHVGIFAGDNKFIHAPSKGRNIRISSLSNQYYKSRYLGARSYL